MPHEDINKQAFREEALDLLAELESALLELEESPDDRALLDRVFRAMHTIKGSGAMFGFDDIASFTHEVETVLDCVRNGEVKVCKELLDLTLAAGDRIQDMLDSSEDGADNNVELSRQIVQGFRNLHPESGSAEAEPEAAPARPQKEAGNAREEVYRVRFRPSHDIFLSGSNPVDLVSELLELGRGAVTCNLNDVPRLSEYEDEACYAWWDIVLISSAGRDALKDVFIFVEDDSVIDIQTIDTETGFEEEEYKRLGEILIERGDLKPEILDRALQAQKPLGTILSDAGVVSREQVSAALKEQKVVKELKSARKPPEASSIRVAAGKLDKLVDLVGELVIVQAQISQVVGERNDQVLQSLAEELERLSDELRDSTLGIRMLPIGTTFSRFSRLVRDLSGELGKKIDLRTEGAETELDKTVIERLGDPLVHLLRNSIDHGIESPEKRASLGKPESGRITLIAEHSGGDVIISIIDDGKGMNPEVLRAKAVEKGIIGPDVELTDKECFKLIFEAGFSTAKAVTSVSGRGVGMDVVKRAIDSLRGSIDIDSRMGVGTTITIKLPLTLAIIDGLQVKVGPEYYVIPLSLVEECVELNESERDGAKGRKIVRLREEFVPYIKVRDWFRVDGKAPAIEQIVVTSVAGQRTGIVVDNVIGEHQTVIKSLGRVYRDVEGISGATIKGDGSMALILDVPRLIRDVETTLA
ncbi:MAG: chemotaxis protein CheA [Desulfovibrio sp.]|uniref:chemotaxis protein CheA n=1 Tax=Desulfovibrio sp. 7SRBS1 TaxID=3378064 RepID=UPI003B41CAA8